MAGRPALPANVHLLHGNPGKKNADELAAHSSSVPIEVPPCPQHLGTAARSEWKRIAPHLKRAGLITALDRGFLAGYCEAWGEWCMLSEKVRELTKERGASGLIDVTPSGYKQISALSQARDRALDRMLRFGKEFGLSPSSRVSATMLQQPSLPGFADPMESFLRAGANISTAG